jgi:hypothetical protein
MAFRKTLRALALPKASTGFGGRSSQGSHTITVFGATGMTGKKAIVFGRNTTKIKKKITTSKKSKNVWRAPCSTNDGNVNDKPI